MASVDVLVMGRHTYDSVLGFPTWPYPHKRVTVLSSQELTPVHNETFGRGPLPELLGRLEHEGVRRVYLDGGAVVRQGLAAGLVTDMTLSWLPILLGTGRPLFGPELPESRWTLHASRSFPSGLVQATYRQLES